MARRVLNVFLSSTAVDLAPYREEIYRRLMSTGLFHCERQEDFGAQNAEAVKFCRAKVEEADLFVGLIGLRRGWEPDGDEARRSITEMEHDWAREKGVSRYIWVAPDDFPVPGNIRENDRLHKRQQAFRGRVMANGERIVSQKGFGSPELLAADVVVQLLKEVVTSNMIRDVRPDLSSYEGSTVDDQKPAIAAAVERLAEDEDVDLLVLARNLEGTDLVELEAKLKARAEKLSAKSAEYWRHIGALAFLHDTQKALAAYEKAVALDPGSPEGWRFLGELQFRLDDLPAAEKSFETLRGFAEHRSRSMGCARLGWIYSVRNDLPASEKIIREALSLAERAQWTEGVARAYGNLGLVYESRGELGQAEEMLLKSLALEAALGSKEGMARAYGNLGLVYDSRGELDRAAEMQLKSLALYEGLGGKEGVGKAHGNLAAIYYARKDRQSMCHHARKERDIWRELGLENTAAEVEIWLHANGCGES
jgi:tetratricopeptide (TPR) repeat protein